ncbi:MAG: PQQ-binding-like beta-propeller repeat protein [Pirellulales bacterium]|nr:PQQ-binding-like beta-propeller repeat protein [Pirellulales bacterium]
MNSSRLASLRCGAALMALQFCCSLLPSVRAGVLVPWTQFQANSAHSGHVAGTISLPTPLWNVPNASIGDVGFVPGVVTDEQRVYVTAYSHNSGGYSYFDVVALNRTNGVKQWSRQLASYSGEISAPAVGNGMVYVHQWGHSGISGGNAAQYPYVTGLNANTGAIQFATSHSGQWSSGSRPTVSGNLVFAAGGYYGGLDAYNAAVGGLAWSTGVNQQYGWIPAADSEHVYVYMGPASASPGPHTGTLYSFNRTNGSLAFKILNPTDTFTLHNGTVFLGGQNDAITRSRSGLTSFDLNAQTVRWQALGNYSGAMAIDQGTVYAANGIELSLLDEATGQKVNSWFAPPSESLEGNLLLTDNVIIAGTTKGTYVIDRSTLTNLWSTSITGDLALGDDTFLISTPNVLYAYAVAEPNAGTLMIAILLCTLLGSKARRWKSLASMCREFAIVVYRWTSGSVFGQQAK